MTHFTACIKIYVASHYSDFLGTMQIFVNVYVSLYVTMLMNDFLFLIYHILWSEGKKNIKRCLLAWQLTIKWWKERTRPNVNRIDFENRYGSFNCRQQKIFLVIVYITVKMYDSNGFFFHYFSIWHLLEAYIPFVEHLIL